MVNIIALLLLSLSHAQSGAETNAQKLGFFFALEKPTPQWALDINAERIGYFLSQRMYGNSGETEIKWQSPEHKAVSNTLRAIFNKYPLMALHIGLGPLGAEGFSMDEVYLSALDAFRQLENHNRSNPTTLVAELNQFKNLFPKNIYLETTRDEVMDFNAYQMKSFYTNIETEIQFSSWSNDPIDKAMTSIGVNKILIKRHYKKQSATEPVSDSNIHHVEIMISAYESAIRDMNYTLKQLQKIYPQFEFLKHLLPAKGNKIQGMVASGFQVDDVVPVEIDGQSHWIFYLPSHEGSNYFDFIIEKGSNNLPSSKLFKFNELCYENLNLGYSEAIGIFTKEGFKDEATNSSKNILVRNVNYSNPKYHYCEKLDPEKGIYSLEKLNPRTILY